MRKKVQTNPLKVEIHRHFGRWTTDVTAMVTNPLDSGHSWSES